MPELLARYGEPTSGGRRHRRRATNTTGVSVEDTAPKSIISRIESDRGTRPRPTQPSYWHGDDPARAPRRSSPPPTSPTPSPSHGAGSPGSHGPTVPTRRVASEERQDPAGDTRLDPAEAGDNDPGTGSAEATGPRITPIARVDPALRDPTLAPTPLPGAGRPWRGEPPAGLAPRPGGSTVAFGPEPAAAVAESDELGSGGEPPREDSQDQQGGHGGEEPKADPSPVSEWAMVASQVGLGVVGGAALWLACEWLWRSIPMLALVVALLVITSLVWVVRYVRRTEDLQTTVIAVLVGLFVTVSPAALLLVGR
ncbi:MAG: hypothetical protein M3308_05745 [Actinomycetota bacterium]|nr:hypothetical protein [Actinomycetota bacterium]